MKKLILPAFALMVLAQWIVPVKMIFDSEAVLTTGMVYKFRTEPIDPSDPFRGKYVTLRFNAQQVVTDTLPEYRPGDEVYASLAEDSSGYTIITNIYPERPSLLDDRILKTTVSYAYRYGETQTVTLKLSFDRFYVEESKASDAERVYWEAQRDSVQVAYALVRIQNGQGIIENVMINDRPLLEIVQELNENEAKK